MKNATRTDSLRHKIITEHISKIVREDPDMRFDRRKVEMLTSMSDERMWGTIKLFASANGVDLSRRKVTPRDLTNLRRMLQSLTDEDLRRVGELTDVFKYGR